MRRICNSCAVMSASAGKGRSWVCAVCAIVGVHVDVEDFAARKALRARAFGAFAHDLRVRLISSLAHFGFWVYGYASHLGQTTTPRCCTTPPASLVRVYTRWVCPGPH